MTRERHPREDLTALLDGALAADRAAEVRAHLEACAPCREQAARLRAAVSTLAASPPAPELPPFFATRLEARLREERERRPRLRRWLRGLAPTLSRPRLALAAAAAAAVVGVAGGLALHAIREGDDRRAMLRDLDLLQDYEAASAVGVDTPEDALIVAQLDGLDGREARP